MAGKHGHVVAALLSRAQLCFLNQHQGHTVVIYARVLPEAGVNQRQQAIYPC